MKLLATLPGHNSNSMESDRDICRFLPDGRFVAYATSTRRDEISENGHVKVAENWQLRRWNKDDGSDVLVGPFSWMSLVAFSPDSKQLALGFSTFRTSDGSKHSTLKPQVPYANPHVSQWTPNGENLALVAPRYDLEKPNRIDVTFWNPLTNETRQLVLNADSALRLRSANFSHDGRYLFLQNDMFFSEIWAIDVDPPARVGFTRAKDFGPTPKQPSAVIGENPVRQRLWKIDTPLDQAPIMPYMGYGINSIHFNYDRSLVSIQFSGKPFKSYNDILGYEFIKTHIAIPVKGTLSGI